MSHIEKDTREAIAAFLPGAIAAALLSYSRFLEEQATADTQTEAKEFKAHHDACKVAIAHIELLVKLAKAMGDEDSADKDLQKQAALANLIVNARAEINDRAGGDRSRDCDRSDHQKTGGESE